MTAWPDARARAHAAAVPLPTDTVQLAEAEGCTLATPLVAAAPVPPFDTAAMDGYAVAGPGPWRVLRQIPAGHGDPGYLGVGEAAEIATGAPVPRGAEAVLRYEDARRSATGAEVSGEAQLGRHIRRTGEDCPAGAELLPAGTCITPVVMGLAASVGLDALPVRQQARVVALITGDEVVHRGLPGNGRVRDAIGPLLPGVVARCGAQLVVRLPVPDRPVTELPAAVDAAAADVVAVCGATAAGPADRLRAVLTGLAARPVVDGVACRPGHPQSLWVLPDGRYVVGMPGNPFAALVACHTLLTPLLAGLAGRALPTLPYARVAAGPELTERNGTHGTHGALGTRIVPVRWAGDSVQPLGHDGPGSLWGAAAADALAVLPPGWAGEPVPLLYPV